MSKVGRILKTDFQKDCRVLVHDEATWTGGFIGCCLVGCWGRRQLARIERCEFLHLRQFHSSSRNGEWIMGQLNVVDCFYWTILFESQHAFRAASQLIVTCVLVKSLSRVGSNISHSKSQCLSTAISLIVHSIPKGNNKQSYSSKTGRKPTKAMYAILSTLLRRGAFYPH